MFLQSTVSTAVKRIFASPLNVQYYLRRTQNTPSFLALLEIFCLRTFFFFSALWSLFASVFVHRQSWITANTDSGWLLSLFSFLVLPRLFYICFTYFFFTLGPLRHRRMTVCESMLCQRTPFARYACLKCHTVPPYIRCGPRVLCLC